MTQTPNLPASAHEAALDAKRIGAEILGKDAGTDPFVAAVRATRMPMVITDPRLPDNPVVFANNAFCRLTGYDRDEIVGRNCRFLQGPETDPETVVRIRAAIDARKPIQVDIRNHRKDGEAFWNRLLLAPVMDAHGDLAYFFASQVDVTMERERLTGLETRNAALTAELTDRLRDLEERETRRLRTELRTQALLDLDDSFRSLDQPADMAFAAAEILGRTLKVSRAGYGTVDLAAETITIERDWNAPGIKTIAGVLHFRDYGSYIDDLKRGDTAVIADTRIDPRTAATSGALEAISARAFINMPVTEAEGLVALLYLNHETEREWPEDDLGFVREVAQRTRMATERKRAEQGLRDLAATLESKVEERTQALLEAEAALRQSQKMEAVGQLTGGLAHDFNNLLASISGGLELLKLRIAQGRLDDLDRYIGIAHSSTRRAAALTHRLLAFSRRQTLAPKIVELNELVAGMEDLVQRTVGPEVSVEVVGSRSLWGVKADPSQIENSLLNLCINARDAMPDGGRLTIETTNRWLDEASARQLDLPEGQYVALSVSDTGTGMAPDIVAKAFDPFFTTKPIGQGTGLGLSMIYGFARQSGGQARIYSEVGQGTTVSIYLPRNTSGATAADSQPVNAEASAAGPVASNYTVLLVDDEAALRSLIADALREEGLTVLEAANAPAALGCLRSDSNIDLLVTDVGLPGGMNGRQVADAARELRPGLKVVFITGYAENAAIGDGQLEPGMSVLTKPFSIAMLTRRVGELLAEPGAASSV